MGYKCLRTGWQHGLAARAGSTGWRHRLAAQAGSAGRRHPSPGRTANDPDTCLPNVATCLWKRPWPAPQYR
jgi:hypothetical protein